MRVQIFVLDKQKKYKNEILFIHRSLPQGRKQFAGIGISWGFRVRLSGIHQD